MPEINLDDMYLGELVQAAFDKYILEKIPELLEKHMPLVDKAIENRINGNYTPEVNRVLFSRIEQIVDSTVGNYLRVGKGRDEVNVYISKYLDKKLEEHVEHQVDYRVRKVLEKLQKDFQAAMPK